MKFKIYVNAGIEIWDEVEAKDEGEARSKAYDLIGHSTYECDITIEKIEDEI